MLSGVLFTARRGEGQVDRKTAQATELVSQIGIQLLAPSHRLYQSLEVAAKRVGSKILIFKPTTLGARH